MTDAAQQLDGFLAKYTAEVEAQARRAVERMQRRIPGAAILVYDNYNALAIGFGPTDKASAAVLSLAVFPRWVTLCFLQGSALTDPEGLMKGTGTRVRHIRLTSPEMLDDPRVDGLIAQAVQRAEPPFDANAQHRLIIKSISAKQRPRRAE